MAKVFQKTKSKKIKKISPKKKLVKKSVKKVSLKIIKKKVVKKVKKTVKTKKKLVVVKKKIQTLERFVGNPVIHPARNTYWESSATFNPTALEHDGKVHIIYRAVGVADISTLGYGISQDGYNVSERSFRPIFIHQNFPDKKQEQIVNYSSGGGWCGGAEDPRVTKIDDKVYITYTAFDGWGSMRVGLTWIDLDNFLNKKWNWHKPMLISPPEQHNKNWILFPEKINGKFAILHDLWPTVSIFYVDRLEDLAEGKYQVPKYWTRTWYSAIPKSWVMSGDRSVDPEKLKKNVWVGDFKDIWVRATGPAPIKTKEGWLVFYHAIEAKDPSKFKVFAMLLDLKDPTKILFRSKNPILEPETFYENEGFKPGVVYACGAVIKDDKLFVYYGGADMVSCVATANLKLFLKELMATGITKLKKGKK